MPIQRTEANSSIEQIDELVRRVELLPDAFARDAAIALVQGVMALHEAAIGKIMEIVRASDSNGGIAAALASDELVSSILAMHGLHPDDLETRVRRAVEKLQFYFDSRGAGIVLLGIEGEMVRVRFSGSRPGNGDAARQAIEEALFEAAPELTTVLIEGVEERRDPAFVPIGELIVAQQA